LKPLNNKIVNQLKPKQTITIAILLRLAHEAGDLDEAAIAAKSIVANLPKGISIETTILALDLALYSAIESMESRIDEYMIKRN
jgi:hypothetical protein